MLFGKSYEWQKIRFWILCILTIMSLLWFWGAMRQKKTAVVYPRRIIVNLNELMISGTAADDDPLEKNIAKLKSLLGTDAKTVTEFRDVLNELEFNPQPKGAALLAKKIPDTARPFYLAIKAAGLRDFAKVRNYLRQAEAREEELKMLKRLGNLALNNKHYFTAVRRLRTAFEMVPKDLQVIRSLAIALYNVPNDTDREDMYKTAIDAVKDKTGERAPNIGAFAFNLALIQQTEGRFDEAEALFWFSLRIFEATLGKDHKHVLQTYNSLKNLYEGVGKDEEVKFLEKYMGSKS